ncbi:MFS multidrug transporter [Colletotrichum musicola]|uniref:MFS multidrug transporter n=1 Tax=Colletotrichum musicola TaxID=2175873 RepID=A0A8H6NC21_9PEZI|nr:MFS multidrug transporter [Colletotrichum musicola]
MEAKPAVKEATALEKNASGSQHGDPGANAGAVTVDWQGQDDPSRPRNWSPARKWTIVATNSLATFMVSFSSSVFSGYIVQVGREFHMSTDVSLLGVSLYVLGFAFGPMVWGPASELCGKGRPLWAGYIIFCVLQILSTASWSPASLLVSRFLQAVAGSSTLAIMSGMFVDFLTDPTSRGIATAVFSISVFCGPAAGPIVGSAVAARMGWRWAGWITLIASAAFGFVAYAVTPETSEAVILRRRARRKLAIMTVYMSFVYGIIYLTLLLYPQAFVIVRGWSFVDSSMSFFGILAGVLIACVVLGLHSVYHVGPVFARTKKHVPERRLRPMMLGSLLLPPGIFWFSWTSSPEIPALAQAFSGVFIGSGSILTFMSGVLYLTEVYLAHANSALDINNLIRSAFAAGFPYAGKTLIVRLGISVGGSILGAVCVALVPFPIVLWRYGHVVRGWSKFAFKEPEA